MTVLEHNLCISDSRESEIFRSTGDSVELFVMGSSPLDTLPPFLLQYKGRFLFRLPGSRTSGLNCSKSVAISTTNKETQEFLVANYPSVRP